MSAAGPLAGVARLRVLVIGGINVDEHLVADREPPDDGCEVARLYARKPGGHAGNCAAALAALGARPTLLGAVGDDDEGRQAVDDLRRAGVDTSAVLVSARPTGRVFIPELGGRRYMLMVRGANDDPALAGRVAALEGEGFAAAVLFDPLPEVAAEVAARRGRLATRVTWSPGGVWVRAPGFADGVGFCDALVLNRVEFALAFGGAGPAEALARAFGGRAGARLVITRGAEGAELAADGQAGRIPGMAVAALDATGAGDAFTAAYVALDAAGAPAETCVRAANAAGALATRALGSRASLAGAAEIEAALGGTGTVPVAAAGPEPVGAER